MRQPMIICAFLFTTTFASGVFADESLNEPLGPLVPVHFSVSSNSTSTSYYPTVTATQPAAPTTARYVPASRVVPAVYVADADEREAADIFAPALTPQPALEPDPSITPLPAPAATPQPAITPVPQTTVTPAPATTVYRPVAPAVYSGTTVLSPAASACCPTPCRTVCSPATTPVRMVSYRPVVETAPMPRDYFVGRGMIGQPVVYVPGQPLRNALRWFFP